MGLREVITKEFVLGHAPGVSEEAASRAASAMLRVAEAILDPKPDIVTKTQTAIYPAAISDLKRQILYGRKKNRKFVLPSAIQFHGKNLDQCLALKDSANNMIYNFSSSESIKKFGKASKALEEDVQLAVDCLLKCKESKPKSNKSIDLLSSFSTQSHALFGIVPILDDGTITFAPPYYPKKEISPFELPALYWFRYIRCVGRNIDVITMQNPKVSILISPLLVTVVRYQNAPTL